MTSNVRGGVIGTLVELPKPIRGILVFALIAIILFGIIISMSVSDSEISSLAAPGPEIVIDTPNREANNHAPDQETSGVDRELFTTQLADLLSAVRSLESRLDRDSNQITDLVHRVNFYADKTDYLTKSIERQADVLGKDIPNSVTGLGETVAELSSAVVGLQGKLSKASKLTQPKSSVGKAPPFRINNIKYINGQSLVYVDYGGDTIELLSKGLEGWHIENIIGVECVVVTKHGSTRQLCV